MRRSNLPQILLSLIGFTFILWGVLTACLYMFGQSISASLTNIRREGGEWFDGKPGRYTYSIGYRFILPDGREIRGTAKRVDDGVYVKTNGTGRIQIRYLAAFPFINSPEEQSSISLRPLVFGATGLFLLMVIRPKKKCNRTVNQINPR